MYFTSIVNALYPVDSQFVSLDCLQTMCHTVLANADLTVVLLKSCLVDIYSILLVNFQALLQLMVMFESAVAFVSTLICV